MTLTALLVAVLVALTAVVPVQAADKPLAVGDRAPALELSDQYGKRFALSEALSTRDFVVVAFYLKAFSGG